MRNSMGACAMVQMPPRAATMTPRGGGGGVGGNSVRTPTPAPPGGGGMYFHPMSFSSPAPRYMYSTPMRATAVPFYPSSPQPYYEGLVKRSPEQVRGVVSLVSVKLWLRFSLTVAIASLVVTINSTVVRHK